MSLVHKTILKAEKIIEDNRLQLLEPGLYMVYGSGSNTYQVSFNADTKKVKCQCKGYRFKGDCYHSESIRIKEKLK